MTERTEYSSGYAEDWEYNNLPDDLIALLDDRRAHLGQDLAHSYDLQLNGGDPTWLTEWSNPAEDPDNGPTTAILDALNDSHTPESTDHDTSQSLSYAMSDPLRALADQIEQDHSFPTEQHRRVAHLQIATLRDRTEEIHESLTDSLCDPTGTHTTERHVQKLAKLHLDAHNLLHNGTASDTLSEWDHANQASSDLGRLIYRQHVTILAAHFHEATRPDGTLDAEDLVEAVNAPERFESATNHLPYIDRLMLARELATQYAEQVALRPPEDDPDPTVILQYGTIPKNDSHSRDRAHLTQLIKSPLRQPG